MRKAEPLAGLGGLLLLVSLFLPWVGSGVSILSRGASGTQSQTELGGYATGWQALAFVDILLVLLALLAIAVPVVSLATRGPAASIGTAVVASALGWIAIVLVGIELLAQDSLRYGAWLALAGSILAWVGSWLSMRDESTPGAAAPELPTRPAPPKISA